MENFNATLRNYAVAEYDRMVNMGEEESQNNIQEELSNDLIILMEDKDILVSHIEASKENVDSKIGDKETEIVKALAEDWKNTENRVLEDQHQRNRNIVEEVIKTCEDFREDISNHCLSLLLL